jgi:hypothetical protein
MAKEITAYVCEYCDKVYRSKSGVREHEKKCFANPATKACRTCLQAIRNNLDGVYCYALEKWLIHPEKEAIGFKHNCHLWEEGEKLF